MAEHDPVTLGIIGCGNISEAYIQGAARSRFVRVKACADLRPEAAQAKAAKHGFAAATIDALLADTDIEIVLNLTIPSAHAEVSAAIVSAGKHVYSEKPLATTFADARVLVETAAARALRIGCAPDTFMGGAHQACRVVVDAGRIGRVVGGSATMVSRGMEHWHPNPGFYFQSGGGPALDMGPYYITQLVNLLGPVRSVVSLATRGFQTRTITSKPLAGRTIPVDVPTFFNGALEFACGANVAVTLSWDVWKTQRVPLELYGTDGTLLAPDPDFFGGVPVISERDGEWIDVDISDHPFGSVNWTLDVGRNVANYRGVGVLDMAAAIRANRPHRASGELALHVLEVLEALSRSSEAGQRNLVETTCQQPAPLSPEEGRSLV